MELKEFTKTVLKELLEAVEEVRKEASRDLRLISNTTNRTVEFDVAVTVENEVHGKATGGIKVLNFMQVQGDSGGTSKNATVSRVKFGIDINQFTKEEERQHEASNNAAMSNYNNSNSGF